jgi:hypothetical protein
VSELALASAGAIWWRKEDHACDIRGQEPWKWLRVSVFGVQDRSMNNLNPLG